MLTRKKTTLVLKRYASKTTQRSRLSYGLLALHRLPWEDRFLAAHDSYATVFWRGRFSAPVRQGQGGTTQARWFYGSSI